MPNRTALPIRARDRRDLNINKEETKALRVAFLGDGNGNFEVLSNGSNNEHYGKVYIRFASGTDNNGNTTYTQRVEALVHTNANFTHQRNLPVLVRLHRPSGLWMVMEVDPIRTNKAGYNTHVLNPSSPRRFLHWERQLQDGKLFAPATNTTDATTVSVQPFAYVFDGAIYNGGKANSIDLSSYIPSAGNERLVLVGQRSHDQTIQIVQGSTRSITTTKYSLSDIDTLIGSFDDYIIPIGAARLADGATTVLETDLHQSLVQRINVPQPRGFPMDITRHIHILPNYQQYYKGSPTISTGELYIQGEFIVA